jgi:5-methylcytosine-specific restriction endonuclease McrBC regulatory subunit McrC
MLKTTDNNGGKEIEAHFLPDFGIIANKKISNLISDDNPNLLVFPNDLNQSSDKISEEYIFSLHNSSLTTGNIMGFIGINNSEMTIQSRFAKNNQDYFLHYMLQKVFSINLFDLKHGISNETIFDFLLYLFPFYLKKALRQGLYKEYHRQEYNDSNFKGTIDFSRHIRKNVPFVGNVAYKVREHSFDNKITQLIRHTIEFVKQHKFAHGILDLDSETQNCVNEILLATPGYDNRERIIILNKNLKPFSHPYFFEYRPLKKICMQILTFEGLKYGKEKDKVYGLLFDGAWLWEEYLNTFLINCGFNHPKNRNSEGAIYLFNNSKGKRFPDFWKKNFIIDAKYKRLADKKVDRNDMNQIISYMYVKKAEIGGFIVPSDNNEYEAKEIKIGQLNGYAGEVNIWVLSIPQQTDNFAEFCNRMKKNEIFLTDLIEKQNYKAHTANKGILLKFNK